MCDIIDIGKGSENYMKKIRNIMVLLVLVFIISGCSKNENSNTISFRDTDDNLLMSGEVVKYAEEGEDASGNPCIVLKISDTKKLYKITDEISKKEDNMIVIWYKFDANKNSYKTNKDDCGNLEKPACLSAAIVSQGFDSDEMLIVGSFTKEEVSNMVRLINK